MTREKQRKVQRWNRRQTQYPLPQFARLRHRLSVVFPISLSLEVRIPSSPFPVFGFASLKLPPKHRLLMDRLDGSIVGFNSPRWFAVWKSKAFLPAGNAVVVVENDVSTQWLPFDGRYDIDVVAISARGTICVTEKRLVVSLHFCDAGTLREQSVVKGVSSVSIDDLQFSPDGQRVLVLSSVPTSTVKLLHCDDDGTFSLTQSVDLRGGRFCGVRSAWVANGEDDFIVWSKQCFRGYTCDAGGQYVECCEKDMPTTDASCCDACGGSVFFGFETGEVRTFCFSDQQWSTWMAHTPEGAVTALTALDTGRVYSACGSGRVYDVQRTGAQALCVVGSRAVRLQYYTDPEVLYIGTDHGVQMLDRSVENGVLFSVSHRLPSVIGCNALNGASDSVAVTCTDGSFAVLTASSGVTLWQATSPAKVVASCTLAEHLLALVCADGVVRGYHAAAGKQLWCHRLTGITPTTCATNGDSKLVCCDERSVFFLCASLERCVNHGYLRSDVTSRIVTVRWVAGENSVLVACQNGELYLISFPDSDNGGVMHDAEVLIQNIWRMDFPLVGMLPCFITTDAINLLVHSVDKDTKLYVLDRRRESDSKVLRPLFLMRDHDSGGTCLHWWDSTTVISAGKDGRVVWRDVAHYQAKLPPIPPCKEKKRVIREARACSFTNGGVLSACVVAGAVVSSSGAGVVRITAQAAGEEVQWQEPRWTLRQLVSGEVEAGTAGMVGGVEGGIEGEELRERLAHLRREWDAAVSEHGNDVPVEALLLPDEVEEFNASCENAIIEMREAVQYHALFNEYTQEVLRKKCCESMAVGRCKVVSVMTEGLEVHNFHQRKDSVRYQQLGKKALFLRQLQKMKAQGRSFTTGTVEAAGSPPSRKVGEPPLDDYCMAVFPPQDVYTTCRAVLQMLLLRGQCVSIKAAFNGVFAEVRDRKRQVLTQVEERNRRCIQIMKQLGEAPGPLFAPVTDREEDPTSLFQVFDDELSEELRALVVKGGETTIVSAANEAALKLWMDGLEKDVELIQATLRPPDFADETSATFVPPDERTEEQVKLFEEFEKKAREELESVNARKDALRNEFKRLVTESQGAAKALDEELRTLQQRRLSTVEQIGETELQCILLLRQLFVVRRAFRKVERLENDAADLRRSEEYAYGVVATRREALGQATAKVSAVAEQLQSYPSCVRGEFPFTDPTFGEKLLRRFARWKRRLDDGKMDSPQTSVAEDTPEALKAAFCEVCETVLALTTELENGKVLQESAAVAVEEAEAEAAHISELVTAAVDAKDEVRTGLLPSLLNTTSLYGLRQGQIQDEKAVVTSDYATSSLRWASDVDELNQLVLSSAAQSVDLLRKIAQREKSTSLAAWETERLRYCGATLQVELRQLHTLRVTRQMQDWLVGDVDISEEKTIAGIQQHIDLVNSNMREKVQQLTAVAARLKHQIAERATENRLMQQECNELKSTVDDEATVKTLVDAHADGTVQYTQRAKEIYETSELEEVARSQQEELLRLKREVDRLRERTFPSFAVVSKRTLWDR